MVQLGAVVLLALKSGTPGEYWYKPVAFASLKESLQSVDPVADQVKSEPSYCAITVPIRTTRRGKGVERAIMSPWDHERENASGVQLPYLYVVYSAWRQRSVYLC